MATEESARKKITLGPHTKQLEKYGYRIRIHPLMDFIRSVDDSREQEKMCSVKIDNCLHHTDRPGPMSPNSNFSLVLLDGDR